MKSKRNRKNNKKHTLKNFKGGSINPSRLPELLYERIYPTKSIDKLKCVTNWVTTCSKLDMQLSNIFLQIILKTIKQSYAHIPTYRVTMNKLCKKKNLDTSIILDQINSYRKFANKYLTYNTNVDKFNQLDEPTQYILFDLVATLDSNVSFLFCIQNVGNIINSRLKVNGEIITSTFKNSIPVWYKMAEYLFSPGNANEMFNCVCDRIYFLIHDTKEPKTKSYYCNIKWKLASPKDIEKSTEDTVYICENYIFDTPKEAIEIYKKKYLKFSQDYDVDSTTKTEYYEKLPSSNYEDLPSISKEDLHRLSYPNRSESND